MKQTLFMVALTVFGTLGAFAEPFYGVAVYYMFAILRPPYIWQWALPNGIRWSLFVAIGTVVAALLNSGRSDEAAGTGRTFARTHAAVLLFAIWVIASVTAAQDRDASWPWFVEYLKIFAMFFVSIVLVRTPRQAWILMLVAAGSLGYVAYEVNFLYFGSGYLGIYHNGYGGLDNNGAGLMLAIAVPMCVWAYMGTSRWWRWIYAAMIPLLLHAVLMTFSRGAMVSLIAAAPFIFLRGRHRFQLLLAAVAMAAIIPWLAGPGIRARFFTLDNYQDESSARSRFGSWAAAYRMALDYPILGVGVRNSSLFSKAYGADIDGRVIHSQYLQILADMGFPGLLFYVVALSSVFVSLRRVRVWAGPRDDEQARQIYAVACGVEGGLVVFCVGSCFLSLDVFELPYVLILIGTQLALSVERLQLQGAGAEARPAPVRERLVFAVPRPVSRAEPFRATRDPR